MRKTGFLIVVALLAMTSTASWAQGPDFQTIMNGLGAKLNAVTYNAWGGGVFSTVSGPSYTPPFNQVDAGFAGFTHIQNGIKDDDHLALLKMVLDGDACTRALLGDAFVNEVQAAYAGNLALVKSREAAFQVWIRSRASGETRIDGQIRNVPVAGNATFNDRKIWTGPTGSDAWQNVTTGASNSLTLSLDSGVTFVGTTAITENVDVPSMWGADGLFSSADGSAGLGDDLAALMAAYLTMGNQGKVDYMQAVLYQTVYAGVLPNIMNLLIASLVDFKSDWDVNKDVVVSGGWYLDEPNDKAYTPPSTANIEIDVSYDPPLYVVDDPGCTGDTCVEYIRLRRVRASVGNIQAGVLTNWIQWYQAGANGFVGFHDRLRASGSLNGSTTNLAVYQTVGGNRAQFLAGCLPSAGWITGQPSVPPGIQFGDTATLSVTASSANPISYQWYSGVSPTFITPISGATSNSYGALVDFYSVPPAEPTKRYYQVRVTSLHPQCGSVTDFSNLLEIVAPNPPAISFTAQPPASISRTSGKTVTMAATATVSPGALSYQWQRFVGGSWQNIAGANATTYAIANAQPASSGTYRLRARNQIVPNSEYFAYSSQCVVTVVNLPTINITETPAGASLEDGEGQSHVMTVAANVTEGVLAYKWQHNAGGGYVDKTGWIDVGAAGSSYTINNAVLADAGRYRCVIQNTHPLEGDVYTRNSSEAVVTVSFGQIWYVDQNAKADKNNKSGTTWVTAFDTIQEGIDAASADGGGTVWVAQGVYDEARPEVWGGVAGSLVVKADVWVYGGFDGTEVTLDERNRHLNVTVIDGSVANGGAAAYHTVVFGGETDARSNMVLDGFHITGGSASGVSGDYHTWRGGGIYVWASSPTIANCYVYGNDAAVSGGGIAVESLRDTSTPYSVLLAADPLIVNCVVSGNYAGRAADDYAPPVTASPWFGPAPNPIRGGGGISVNAGNPQLQFVTVVDNDMDGTSLAPPAGDFFIPVLWNFGLNGGGAYSWNGNVDTKVVNAIVWDNAVSAMGVDAVAPAVAPGDPPPPLPYTEIDVSYSVVTGGFAGVANLATNPNLNANFVPQSPSSALDSGTPMGGVDTDLRGVPRPLGAEVDRGAMELSANPPTVTCNAWWEAEPLNFLTRPDTDSLDIDDVENVLTSEVPIDAMYLEPLTFTCAHIATGATVELVVVDMLGREARCTTIIPVTEDEAPVVGCVSNVVFALDAAGTYALSLADMNAIAANSTDNCGVDWTATTVVPDTFTCADVGDVVVEVTVYDGEGNAANDWCTITVIDDTPATPVCNTLDVYLLDSDSYQLTQDQIEALAAGSTDNCGVDFSKTRIERDVFTCDDVDAIGGDPVWVELRIHDVNGNTAYCNAAITVYDITPPVIQGVVPQQFSAADPDYAVAQALAGVSVDDFCDDALIGDVVVTAVDKYNTPVAFPIPADYDLEGLMTHEFTLTYNVSDLSGNAATPVSTTLTLITDMDLPVFTILGENPATIECPDTYIDAGATVWDPNAEEDITDLMVTVNLVNSAEPAAYLVTYTVPVPGMAFSVSESRTVNVVDTTPPSITLTGAPVIGWQTGVPYVESGAMGSDSCYGLILGYETAGTVDVDTPGEYVIEYWVTDGYNDSEIVTRTVIVGDLLAITRNPAGGRMYTTSPLFDLNANYTGGINMDTAGYHQWFRDTLGLGIEAPDLAGNTVTLTVNPATHPLGVFNYRLRVTDATRTLSSSIASVEVREPITILGNITDVMFEAGQTYNWSASVTGGLGVLQMQWQRYNEVTESFEDVVNGPFGGGVYAGATSGTLRFQPFAEEMAGLYRLTVADDFTEVVVGPATVTEGKGVPATGIFGLAALALASALGGALAIRKRK